MTTNNNKIGGVSKPVFGVALVLAVIGIAAWIFQLTKGMQVTGLDNNAAWGLYIAAFFVAVGGGAALLAICGISEFKAIISPQARLKVLVAAMAAFVIGGILITMDLGNPVKMFHLITSFNFNSLMVWDFWLLAISFVVALVYFLKARSGKGGGKALGGIALAAALLVVVVEGFMLTNSVAHEMWGSGMTVVAFLVGAGLVGCALALLLAPQEGKLAKVLTALLVVSLVITIVEVLTGVITGNPAAHTEMSMVLAGTLAPFFWVQIALGIAVPLFLLPRGKAPLAAILVIVGVLAEKVWILAAGQSQVWIAHALNIYLPSLIEYLAVLGAVGLGVVIFGLLAKLCKTAE